MRNFQNDIIMKTKTIPFRTFALLILFVFCSGIVIGGENLSGTEDEQFNVDTLQFKMYHGVLRDAAQQDPLIFANIVLKGTNIATITNSDGEFTLKIPKASSANTIVFSHIGYTTKEMNVSALQKERNAIYLSRESVNLDEINIYPYDADFLVRHILANASKNYSIDANMMKGFYRETIKRNRSYVGIAEAVVDIYKAGYQDLKSDQIQIYKGRKTEDPTKMDTLVFKLQGGPSTVLLFDIIKSPGALLSPAYIDEYNFEIENVVMIDGKPHFVVAFTQIPESEYPLYNGKYYIETNNLALTSAEFSLNLEDVTTATNSLIRKKPIGLKVTAKQVNYLVQYREQDGKWFFSYARGEMVLKFDWKKRLFNTTYSAMMEVAITDRMAADSERFKRAERFKQNQIFAEEVAPFGDEDFWGHHNTIEPDESIQAAINKLKKRGKF